MLAAINPIPVESRKWLTVVDVCTLYPEAYWETINAMVHQETWPIKSVSSASGKRIRRYIERDAFDAWVQKNGIPTGISNGEPRLVTPEVFKPRVPWTYVRDDVLEAKIKARQEKVNARQEKTAATKEKTRRARIVEQERAKKKKPRKLVSWAVTHAIAGVLVKHGGPSGSGQDLEELRRVLSLYVLECNEPADPRLWR